MISRVLVPLDGSELAERALVVAGDLAESLTATIILARAVPALVLSHFYTPNLWRQLEQAQTQEAEAYLAATAERLRKDLLSVETRLLRGEVAATLVAAAAQERCNLIVITSHGMSGLGSQVFGSTAQKLLYSAHCPVLVVRCTQVELQREEEQEVKATDEALLARLSTQSHRGGMDKPKVSAPTEHEARAQAAIGRART